MKKHMISMAEKIWALRGLLTVFCVAAVLFGASFVSHADTVKGTITGSNVNVRETASTSAAAVATLSTNDLVDVLAETTGDDDMKWYKITTESGVTGYVRSDLIKKATVTVNVTQTDSKTAYIAGSNANIRQDASTSSSRVANAMGGSRITIIGEATGADGYKWYQIEFQANGTTMSGFIRSDLITFEAPAQDPEVTEIEGEMSENSDPESTSEPASSEEPSESEEPSGSEEPSEEKPVEDGMISIPLSGNEGTLVILEPISELENIPFGFEQTELKLGDEVFTVWGKGQFYIMYASLNDSPPQFYLYDAINKSFVAYMGLLPAEDASLRNEKIPNYKLIAIIAIIVAVVFALVIGILSYKISNSEYRDDDDDDDDDDNDDIFVDEAEDDYLDLTETANLSDVSTAVNEYQTVEENYTSYATETNLYETQMTQVYETPVEESVYTVPDDTVLYESSQAVYAEPEQDMSAYVSEEESYEQVVYEDDDEDDEEIVSKSRKSKKEKKKFGQRLLDYFTVEVDDDDDDEDDDDDDDDEYVSRKKKTSVNRFDDDDDDDLNFIDL